MAKLSGSGWVSAFKGSKDLGTLKGSFATNMKKFHAALQNAGARMRITSTYRPPERAFLMYWAWKVAKGLDPSKVPARAGVDIDWVHKDGKHMADLHASQKAAEDMVAAYGIVREPAPPEKHSKHELGEAADIWVSWSGSLVIVDAHGKTTTIASSPRNQDNEELHKVALTYGVKHDVPHDPPHWSTGH
jgi:hypothetical protein